jgi:glycosyltransferase involved in cell wall biosynthesis
VRIVADRIQRTKVLVVGEGPMRPEIERLVAELALEDVVVLPGSRSDVAAILSSLDVFVLSSYTECFPLSLLEAMAAGRPAVCTAVGGIPEMIDEGRTGYVVPPRDPEALADRISLVLSDPHLADQMGRAARARVESMFSLTVSVSEAERAFEEIVGGRAGVSGA